jgi:tetrahydromethanopterin:alpha-L-glutamate ligase
MRIPIFTDEVPQNGGWHGEVLLQAFAKRGHEAVLIDLHDCVIDLSGNFSEITIPTFNTLPPCAFIRGVAPGSLQQVITRLNVLHMLKMQGVYIYNDAKSIERTVDKGMTSFLLKQMGVSTPATWVCESRSKAHQIIQTEIASHQQVVIKPLFGSQGKGVRKLTDNSRLPVPKELFVDGVYYLQRFIQTGQQNCDYRVFVINQHAVATMQRSGVGWLNNVAQGAQCTEVKDEAIANLAIQAAAALAIDYCGVDIIKDEEGQLWVLEVNSIPAWKGLQSVVSVNIAQLLVDDLLEKINAFH